MTFDEQFFRTEDIPVEGPARELVGYGAHPPHVRWENDARVAVQIDCQPPDSDLFAALELTSELRGTSYNRAPAAGTWRLSVPADYAYRLAATYLGGRYPAWTRNVPVLPPLRRIYAQVRP